MRAGQLIVVENKAIIPVTETLMVNLCQAKELGMVLKLTFKTPVSSLEAEHVDLEIQDLYRKVLVADTFIAWAGQHLDAIHYLRWLSVAIERAIDMG